MSTVTITMSFDDHYDADLLNYLNKFKNRKGVSREGRELMKLGKIAKERGERLPEEY